MKRRAATTAAPFAVLALLATLAGCAATRPVSPGLTGGDGSPASSGPDASSGRRRTLAALDFDNNSVTDRQRLDFARQWLPDLVTARVSESGQMRVVERRELHRILAELKLGSSELATKEARLHLGRITGAQTMVFGGFSALGQALQLDARVVDVETGVVLHSVIVNGEPTKMRELGEDLAGRLAAQLGVKLASKSAEAGLIDARGLEAAQSYYRGLELERAGQTDAAIGSYKRALELNRNDEEARIRLKRLLGVTP